MKINYKVLSNLCWEIIDRAMDEGLSDLNPKDLDCHDKAQIALDIMRAIDSGKKRIVIDIDRRLA